MDHLVPKAFDYYASNLYSLKEIGDMLEIKEGSVMYLVKLDPRYPELRVKLDAERAAAREAKNGL